MKEQPNLEQHKEDLYEPAAGLGDMANELARIALYQMPDESYEFIAEEPLRTVEQRYAEQVDDGGPKSEQTNMIAEIEMSNPEKIQRINKIIGLVNENMKASKDTLLHRRYYNELVRLIQGPDQRMYFEEGTDPDLLEL